MIYLPRGFLNQESKKVFLYILILLKRPFKNPEISFILLNILSL